MNSTNFKSKKYLSLFLFFLPIIVALAVWWLTVTNTSTKNNIPRVYYSALMDVEQVRADEISTNLTAIVKDNPNIQWQGDRLKVATFAKAKYQYEIGSTEPQSRDLWVTVVPELKNFCTAYASTGREITPRIEQLLGLPPGQNEPRKIVEFWVEAKDLFRPTPDPEITDREAELEFRLPNEFSSVSDKYKEWFNRELDSFKSRLKEMNPAKMPAPWTRLGYTYDWGESTNHIGLSEFVLTKGANLEVDSVATVENYCRENISEQVISNK